MKKITRKIFTVFLLFLLCPVDSNSQEMRLDWKDKLRDGKSVPGYTIYIGTMSRIYDQKRHFNGQTLAINVADLPLRTASPNFISAQIDGELVYSSEIVILWTGDSLDSDKDGLIDSFEEKVTGTLPNKKDTDEDGIPDGEEYVTWKKNWKLDFDEDSLINILDKDSDNDGVPDGEDPDIRRIPSLFQTSQELVSAKQNTFVHLFQKVKVASDLRKGSCEATFKWDPADSQGARYRIFCRKKGEPYNYDLWELETTETTGTVVKLDFGTIYYFVVRAVTPDGGAVSSDSNEVEYKTPKKECN